MEVTGERIVAGGVCLSRDEQGRIVFVSSLLPGESADVEQIYRKGSTSHARVVQRHNDSSDRVNPPCPYVKNGCGGCDWQHISGDAQTRYKRDVVIDSLTRVGKIENAEEIVDDCVVLSRERYRTTARILATSSSWGFRAAHSHAMVDVDDCMVLHRECLGQAHDVMSSLHGNEIHEAQVRRAPDVFEEVKLAVSSSSFYQSHIDAPHVLVDLIREYVDALGDKRICVDLYSGVGVIALGLASHGHSVVAVEGNPHAVRDAKKNLSNTDVDILLCDVKKFRYNENKYGMCDVVIADPSREGIGKEALSSVMSCDADHVILVSCDPASGARDIAMLIENGYTLHRCVPVDMFGYTHHVEMVSFLSTLGE